MHTTRSRWGTASETDLLLGVRAGDRDAFSALYRRTSKQLLHAVQQRIRDRAQAEEVLQEVFLEVWQNAASFDAERLKAFAWMHVIAHHKTVDRIRHAQRSRDRDHRIGVRDHEPVVLASSDHLEYDDRAALRRALASLTPLQREAVMLRYLHELTTVETAQVLGANAATTKTRVRDGLSRLRVLMATTAPST